MEKRKYELKAYTEMREEHNVGGKDGTEITVLSHIPYTEKENMAKELAGATTIEHDGTCIYRSYDFDKMKMYLIAKYYTDIDTDEATPEEIADFLINNGLFDAVRMVIDVDFGYVLDLYYELYEALDTIYADDNSLTKALRTSFGFLFNGEDVTETLAKAETTKESMVELMQAMRNVQAAKTEPAGPSRMNVGGKILSFSKREIDE